jgi:class 3 adenylate cyclase
MTSALKNLYERLALGHLTKGLSQPEKRAIRITAMTQVIMIALPTLLLPQVLFIEPPGQMPYSMTLLAILIPVLLFSRYLLYRRMFTAGAVLTLVNVQVHISGLCVAFADDPAYLGYLVLAILPFLAIDSKKKVLQWTLVAIPSISFLLYQYYYRVMGGEGLFGPPKWTGSADYFMGPFTLLFIFLLVVVKQFVDAVEIAEARLAAEHEKSENLIRNILPNEVADELKKNGIAKPQHFESATVCFTDFEGFTKIAEKLSPAELVAELDFCFSHFDRIIEKHGLEKLKTIGDSYMFAGGIPVPNQTHAIDCVRAALEIQAFMDEQRREKTAKGLPYWELRLGIHSGDLVAGVIGKKKFAYDVWSDTVNTASRCESSGVAGKINISGATFELVKNEFTCEFRGKIPAKNKGEIDMYFVMNEK